jgi:putative addiction module CopG family antidote
MTIEISPELESLIHGIYAGGRYANETEVVAAAVQLLHQREQLRSHLQRGCDELERGKRLNADVVFSQLRKRAAELDVRVQ